MSGAVSIIRADGEGEHLRFWGGGILTMKATAAETDGAFLLFEDHMPKGKSTPLHAHANEDEALYVLEGEIVVHIGRTIPSAPAESQSPSGASPTPSWSRRRRRAYSACKHLAAPRRSTAVPASQPAPTPRSPGRSTSTGYVNPPSARAACSSSGRPRSKRAASRANGQPARPIRVRSFCRLLSTPCLQESSTQ